MIAQGLTCCIKSCSETNYISIIHGPNRIENGSLCSTYIFRHIKIPCLLLIPHFYIVPLIAIILHVFLNSYEN